MVATVRRDRSMRLHQARIAPHQGYAGGFHRDVGTTPHRDADIGCGKCGCVIHPVTDHGDHLTFPTEPFDFGRLSIRLYVREDVPQPNLGRHVLRGSVCRR